MTGRWIITTPAPKTAVCPSCKVKRNRMSVYPTPEGKRCYACLQGPISRSANPSLVATTAPVQRPTFAIADRVVTGCAADCARLPRHKGACRPTLRRSARLAA